MLKKFRIFKIFKNKSFRNLFAFDLMYQCALILVLIPFSKELISLTFRFTKIGFFSVESVGNFLKSPVKIIFLISIAVIFGILKLFEINSFIFTCIQIKNKKDVTLLEIFNNSYKLLKIKFKKFYLFKNIFILIFVIFNVPLRTYSHKKLVIPDYISSHFLQAKVGMLIFVLYILLFVIISIKLILIYHIFIIENKTFFESIILSFKRTRKNIFKTIKIYFFIFLQIFLLKILNIVFLLVIILLFYGQTENKVLSSVSIMVYFTIATGIKIISNTICNFIVFNLVSKLYFTIHKEEVDLMVYPTNKIRAKMALTLIFLVFAGSLSKYRSYIEEINFYHSFKNLKPDIMAHRGSTKNAPENTMEAINEAIELGADFAEIDVMLTKDNVVVLSHDPNLKRLSHENVKIKDLTFEELKKYKIKSKSLNKEFEFVDLKTVLENTKGKIKLNIELKPVSNDEQILAKEVSKLIQDKSYDVVVSSLSLKSLKEIEKIDPSISTGLILAVAYGRFHNIPYVDFFCVEQQFATTENIRKIHKSGKRVYVWTTNDISSLNEVLAKGVDGIITDEVTLSKEILTNEDFNFNEIIINKIISLIS